jgi:lipid II:glycine glycyltransferase (peptidoglycan interpeptide bridge formation enzyme)
MDVREYQKFCWHSLDVRADVETLHQKFHSCIQRPIQRADRECLSYEQGDSDRLLRSFYDLLLLTRRRHQLLPQPLAWFRNLVACLGNKLSIHVASKNGHAIAAMLTLLYGKSLVYKYGSSDARFHNLGAMPFLFWKAIQNGKEVGADHFDLGRSDLENVGLQAFKDHLGATRAVLKYYRYPPCAFEIEKSRWSARIARQVCSRLPGPVLSALGKIMYKHAG